MFQRADSSVICDFLQLAACCSRILEMFGDTTGLSLPASECMIKKTVIIGQCQRSGKNTLRLSADQDVQPAKHAMYDV